MKKLFVILIAGLALTACGERNNSEANRDDSDNYESPAVTPQDNSREGMDTTGVDMQADTTSAGGTVGATSGSGVDGSDMNGANDESSTESAKNP